MSPAAAAVLSGGDPAGDPVRLVPAAFLEVAQEEVPEVAEEVNCHLFLYCLSCF